MKQPFSMFKRRLPTGRAVWYFYYYDETGRRRKASTGKTTKAEAIEDVYRQLAGRK